MRNGPDETHEKRSTRNPSGPLLRSCRRLTGVPGFHPEAHPRVRCTLLEAVRLGPRYRSRGADGQAVAGAAVTSLVDRAVQFLLGTGHGGCAARSGEQGNASRKAGCGKASEGQCELLQPSSPFIYSREHVRLVEGTNCMSSRALQLASTGHALLDFGPCRFIGPRDRQASMRAGHPSETVAGRDLPDLNPQPRRGNEISGSVTATLPFALARSIVSGRSSFPINGLARVDFRPRVDVAMDKCEPVAARVSLLRP